MEELGNLKPLLPCVELGIEGVSSKAFHRACASAVDDSGTAGTSALVRLFSFTEVSSGMNGWTASCGNRDKALGLQTAAFWTTLVDIVLSVGEKEIDSEFNRLTVFINELTAVDLLQPVGRSTSRTVRRWRSRFFQGPGSII